MSTEYHHSADEGYVREVVDTGSQTAEITGHIPYHQFRVSNDDGELINDGSDTEVITIKLVNGLQVARENRPADVLAFDGDVSVAVNGAETTKAMTDGSVSFNITTSKPAGASITVRAVGLNNHPAESDSAAIEVIS
jgi:hypothetical protein